MIGMGNQLNEIGWLRGQPVMEGILIVDFSPSHNKDLYYLPRPCFKRSHFPGNEKTDFPSFWETSGPAKPDREGPANRPNLSNLVRQEARLSWKSDASLPFLRGKGSQRRAVMGSFGGDELTDYLITFWPHVRFQTIRKNTCHTREVRQYPTKLRCA